MRFLPTAGEMRNADADTIHRIGIPGCVLMERAAMAIADAASDYLAEQGAFSAGKMRVLCVCGTGNNGGDGAACARILAERGIRASIAVSGKEERFSEEMALEMKIARNEGVEVIPQDKIIEAVKQADLIVDALFGTGLSRSIEGAAADLIRCINASDARVIAADIPSGIHADTGQVLGEAVRADETVTMQYKKRGLVLYPGAEYAGTVHIAQIGIVREETSRGAYSLEESDLPEYIPERVRSGNKGSFGKVLIAAGTPGIAGASYLASLAALRTGCGMVKIIAPEENRIILQEMLPEAMLSLYRDEEEAGRILRKEAAWADVIAAGPGIGTGSTGRAIVKAALETDDKPLVLDADALNLIAAAKDGVAATRIKERRQVILTPHMGEMSRLSGYPVTELKTDPVRFASDFAKKNACVLVMKDARSVIAGPEGDLFINESGTDGMATAGSGDVLTGITAALAARGCSVLYAAACGAFVHGLAGEAACEKLGASYMKAGDIISEIGGILQEYHR